MSEPFQILVDRLKDGKVYKIDETFAPSFFEIDEPDLRFDSPVYVQGEAYLTDGDLILRLKAKTKAMMPCAVCNKMIEKELKVDNFYHAQPLAEIRSGIFDFRECLREDLLIELPQTIECNQGKCPDRPSLAAYIRSQGAKEKPTYFPFSDIDIK